MLEEEKLILKFKRLLNSSKYEGKLAAIVPCYKTRNYVVGVVANCLLYVDLVICIDDKCPMNTGEYLKEKFHNEKVIILNHSKNLGVGAAFKSGLKLAKDRKMEIVIKIDSDGQMNPKYIPYLVNSLIKERCALCKGNRFTRIDELKEIPKVRLIGNIALSYLTKITTGYWELFDPTNGFFAYKVNTLPMRDFKKINNRYFFETDLLFRCALENVFIEQIPMKPKYSGEISSLNPIRSIPFFLAKHLEIFFKRIIFQYFILDFNYGSLCLIFGLITFLPFISIGGNSLYEGVFLNNFATKGTIGIFVILGIISIQFFLAFFYIDSIQKVNQRKLKNIKKIYF